MKNGGKQSIKKIFLVIIILVFLLNSVAIADSIPNTIKVKTPINMPELSSKFEELNNTVKYWIAVAIALTLIISIIILYTLFFKAASGRAHAIYRRQVLEDILTVIAGIALLGGGGIIIYMIMDLFI